MSAKLAQSIFPLLFSRYRESCNSHCRDTLSSGGLSPRGGQASFAESGDPEAAAKLVSNNVRGIKDPEEIT